MPAVSDSVACRLTPIFELSAGLSPLTILPLTFWWGFWGERCANC